MSRLLFVIGGSGSGRRATSLNISKTIKSFNLFEPLVSDTNPTTAILEQLNTRKDIVYASTEPKYAFQLKKEIEKKELPHRVFILFMDIDQKNRIKNILDDKHLSTTELKLKIDKEEQALNHFFNTLQVSPDFTITTLDHNTQNLIITKIYEWLKKPTPNTLTKNSNTAHHRTLYHHNAPHTHRNTKPK